jgi:hypothetical protein
MAIEKAFTTPHGITATYHRLVKAEIRADDQRVELMVAIYASQEARAAGGTPLWHEYVTAPFADLATDPRADLYALLSDSYLAGGTAT